MGELSIIPQVSIGNGVKDVTPRFIGLNVALDRIKSGVRSKERILEIRASLNPEVKKRLKETLPSVLFSGTFANGRLDANLIKHSGFLILDFDHVDLQQKKVELLKHPFIYAVWVSPSGDGVKALVRIADGNKHREHFQALQDIFKDVDPSGINVGRLCFESYDPEIWINDSATPFNKIKKIEKVVVKEIHPMEVEDSFKKLVVWLTTKKNAAFQSGERNTYIFKLASACCRFGIDKYNADNLICSEYSVGNDFTMSEMKQAISSAYRSNQFGTAFFEKGVLVDSVSRSEVNSTEFVQVDDPNFRVDDTVYGFDAKEGALALNQFGFQKVVGIDVYEIDRHFKPKRGELTLLSGHGNYGKSAYKKWYFLIRILLYGEKVATFSPEDCPPEEYFHDYVEMLLGCECTPNNPNNPSKEVYEKAYDFVSKNIFYVNPESLSPTPDLIKERFLALVVQEKVDFVCIDPFNQLTNDYGSTGGRSDKYLESLLSDFSRFAKKNDIFFWIVAHPKSMRKISEGTMKDNLPCPDVYDIADGAMWNNKMDNILIYHRGFAQTAPDNPSAELHSKKIKRKTVGRRGFVEIEYIYNRRRFTVNGIDVIENALNEKRITFRPSLNDLAEPTQSALRPSTTFETESHQISTPKQKKEDFDHTEPF